MEDARVDGDTRLPPDAQLPPSSISVTRIDITDDNVAYKPVLKDAAITSFFKKKEKSENRVKSG